MKENYCYSIAAGHHVTAKDIYDNSNSTYLISIYDKLFQPTQITSQK